MIIREMSLAINQRRIVGGTISRDRGLTAWTRLAKSNLPEHGDGAQIYEKWVKPAFIDIDRPLSESGRTDLSR